MRNLPLDNKGLINYDVKIRKTENGIDEEEYSPCCPQRGPSTGWKAVRDHRDWKVASEPEA